VAGQDRRRGVPLSGDTPERPADRIRGGHDAPLSPEIGAPSGTGPRGLPVDAQFPHHPHPTRPPDQSGGERPVDPRPRRRPGGAAPEKPRALTPSPRRPRSERLP